MHKRLPTNEWARFFKLSIFEFITSLDSSAKDTFKDKVQDDSKTKSKTLNPDNILLSPQMDAHGI